MALTLRVSSYQGQAMGAAAVRVFETGGSIGRAPENDWVLPDPERFVSSRHASISLEGGAYVLTDSSTNGTVVNGQDLPRGGRVRLSTGDLLIIGNYEISVAVAQGMAASPPLSAGSPHSSVGPFDGEGIPGHSSLDPLDFFAEPPPAPPFAGSAGTSQDHAPPESEFFAAPGVKPETPPLNPAPSAAGPIPEDWDQTSFSAPADSTGSPPGPASASQPIDPSPSVDPWADAPHLLPPAPSPALYVDSSATRPPMSPPMPPPSAPPPPGAPTPPRPPLAPVPSHPWPGDGAAGLTPQTTAGSPLAGGVAGPSVPTTPAAPADGVTVLLRAAGVDPAAVDERTLAALGEVLKVVVEGLMDVLKARSAIKSEFRVPVTTLKPVENNPLKFSVNAEDALFNLFARRGQSYQEPVEAFREAFDDLRAHQVAIMAGLRAAFASLLAKFDPDRLQESFDRGLKRGAILDIMNKTKYWDLYREMYEELGDGDVAFRRLFGDEFARAYEDQMQRLIAVRNRR